MRPRCRRCRPGRRTCGRRNSAGSWRPRRSARGARRSCVPQPISIAFTLLAAAALVVGLAAARAAKPPREELITSWALAVLALALSCVPAFSVSPAIVVLSLLAAGGVAGTAIAPPRTWPAAVLLPVMFALRAAETVPWVGRGLVGAAPKRLAVPRPGAKTRAVLPGVLVSAGLVVVVGGLLISADDGLSWAIERAWDHVADLMPGWTADDVVGRVVLAAFIATALLVAVHTRLVGVPATPALPFARRDARTWALPLGSLAVMIGLFLAVQALTASGHDVIARRGGPTYAERVHQGFGQLLVVSMIVVAVLAWAGRMCDTGDAGQRRILALTGGPVVAVTLGLAGVALDRLWSYEEAYGFTRMRLLVGAFELWVAAVLLLVAAAWFAPVAKRLPVLAISSAGVAVLVMSLTCGDATVASRNVDRYEHTGKIDTWYLSRLSPDAVPAIDDLPSPLRECVLTSWLAEQPSDWTVSADAGVQWNLAVDRAERVFAKRPIGSSPRCAEEPLMMERRID